jgi:hypothetical protein
VDESRVSAVGADASSMLSPELAERSSRKKCDRSSIQMDSNRTQGGSSARAARTSDAQIEHQTEWLQDEKDLTLKGLLRKCVRNSMRPHVALQKSARREMPTPGGALSENQKPSPKIATSDLLRLRPRAIRGLVNALTSIFRPRISNYSAALNAAQR